MLEILCEMSEGRSGLGWKRGIAAAHLFFLRGFSSWLLTIGNVGEWSQAVPWEIQHGVASNVLDSVMVISRLGRFCSVFEVSIVCCLVAVISFNC